LYNDGTSAKVQCDNWLVEELIKRDRSYRCLEVKARRRGSAIVTVAAAMPRRTAMPGKKSERFSSAGSRKEFNDLQAAVLGKKFERISSAGARSGNLTTRRQRCWGRNLNDFLPLARGAETQRLAGSGAEEGI
jgi:hypothetical protein